MPTRGHQVIGLPEAIMIERGDLGSSKTFRMRNGVHFEHSERYTAAGPFDLDRS
jgi:hypothetical protein